MRVAANQDRAQSERISGMRAAAEELGVRDTFHEDHLPFDRAAVFAEFARLAADGTFTVPVSATFPLEDWRAAMEISLSGQARGKLLLLP